MNALFTRTKLALVAAGIGLFLLPNKLFAEPSEPLDLGDLLTSSGPLVNSIANGIRYAGAILGGIIAIVLILQMIVKREARALNGILMVAGGVILLLALPWFAGIFPGEFGDCMQWVFDDGNDCDLGGG